VWSVFYAMPLEPCWGRDGFPGIINLSDECLGKTTVSLSNTICIAPATSGMRSIDSDSCYRMKRLVRAGDSDPAVYGANEETLVTASRLFRSCRSFSAQIYLSQLR
jgi:hypothetical protein